MKTTLHTTSRQSFQTIQHTEIAGYDLAYNKIRKVKKYIVHDNGTKEVVPMTILTLCYKTRNGARAYMNHYTNGENFTTTAEIIGSYRASAKGLKKSFDLIKLYLASATA